MRKILYIIVTLLTVVSLNAQVGTQGINHSGTLNTKPLDIRWTNPTSDKYDKYRLITNVNTGQPAWHLENIRDTISEMISDSLGNLVLTLSGDVSGDLDNNSIGNGKVTYLKLSQAVKDSFFYKVNRNANITGATKTKITYDSKGLVTAGNDATTNDISDFLNKRYVTDANLVVINNTSGTNTGDQDLSGYLLSSVAASTYAPINSPTFTGTVVLPSTTSIGTVSNTEISYLDGVTSSIQTQLGTYLPLIGATYTTTTGNGLALTTSTLSSGNLVSLTRTGTASLTNSTVLNVSASGANSNASQTTYAAQFSNTSTGTTNTNVGVQIFASGGTTTNYPIQIFGAIGQGIFRTVNPPSTVSSTQIGDWTGSGYACRLEILRPSNGAAATTFSQANADLTITQAFGAIILAPTVTTSSGISASTSTLSSGNLLSLVVMGTAAASSTQTGLNISTSGANATSSQTTYASRMANSHTGTSSTNVTLELSSSGGTINNALSVIAGNVVLTGSTSLFIPKAYTVATLPTGIQGAFAYVTDATAPTYLGSLTGGGAVVCPVFYNGSAWVSH